MSSWPLLCNSSSPTSNHNFWHRPTILLDRITGWNTEVHLMVRSRFVEICSCCCLSSLPRPCQGASQLCFAHQFVHLCRRDHEVDLALAISFLPPVPPALPLLILFDPIHCLSITDACHAKNHNQKQVLSLKNLFTL